MKKLFTALAIAIFGISGFAQDLTTEIEMYQNVFNAEKKVMVAEFMALNENESPAFWEVYNAYQDERAKLGKSRLDLLQRYADSYAAMNDESAAPIFSDYLSLQKSILKIKQKYAKKMSKSLGAKRAVQFIQFEDYLDRAIGLYIMENVPFVGELN